MSYSCYLKIIVCFIFNIFSIQVFSTNYYVAENGDDTNSGLSVSTAFANIQKPIRDSLLCPGDTLFILENPQQYTGFDVSGNNGTADAPIVFMGIGENVEIARPLYTSLDTNVLASFRNTGIILNQTAYIEINGLKVNGLENKGIFIFESNQIIIRNNIFTANARHNILIGCSTDIRIESNEASLSTENVGISISSSSDNCIITGNYVYNNFTSGIQLDGALADDWCQSINVDGLNQNIIIEKNILLENGFGNGNGAGAALNASGGVGVIVRNNLFIDNYSTGIALYQGGAAQSSDDAMIANNTIINNINSRWCMDIRANGTSLYNNIIINKNPAANRGGISIGESYISTLNSDYNVLDNRINIESTFTDFEYWQTTAGFGIHSMNIDSLSNDPLFSGLPNDYHLHPASPLIDAGSNNVSSFVFDDFDNNIRPSGNQYDIGCHEYVCPDTAIIVSTENDKVCYGNSTSIKFSGLQFGLNYEIIRDGIRTGIEFDDSDEEFVFPLSNLTATTTLGIYSRDLNNNCESTQNELITILVAEVFNSEETRLIYPDTICFEGDATIELLHLDSTYSATLSLNTETQVGGDSIYFELSGLTQEVDFDIYIENTAFGCLHTWPNNTISVRIDPQLDDLYIDPNIIPIQKNESTTIRLENSLNAFEYCPIINSDELIEECKRGAGVQNIGILLRTPDLEEPSSFAVKIIDISYNQCSYISNDAITVEVIEKECILLTPDGSFGENDALVFNFLDGYTFPQLTIFDRNGSIIYNHPNYDSNSPWKGTYKNKALPSGPYFYNIFLANTNVNRSGCITLLRNN